MPNLPDLLAEALSAKVDAPSLVHMLSVAQRRAVGKYVDQRLST